MRGAFDLLPSPVVLLNADGVIREANAAWCADAGLGGAVTAGGAGRRYDQVLRGAGAHEAVELARGAALRGVARSAVLAWHDEAAERWVSVVATPCAGDRVLVEHRDATAAQRDARRALVGERLGEVRGELDHAPEVLRWLCDVMGWSAAAVWRAEKDGALSVASVVTPRGGGARAWAAVRMVEGAAVRALRAGAPRWSALADRGERALLREALRARAEEVTSVLAVPTSRGAVTFYAPHRRRPEGDLEALLAARFAGALPLRTDAPPELRALRRSTRGRVELAAMTRAPVLLAGEAHTGKSTLAAEIHGRSERAAGPLVRVACGAGDALAALAGEERWEGDARELRPGAIERARGGTLVLEDLEELAPTAQAWLLDALDRGRFRRQGAADESPVDVRLIACARAPLAAMRDEGRVDPLLLERLAVLVVEVLPLRARGWELVEVARGVLGEVALAWSRPAPALTEDAERAIVAHDWPGNLRELRAVLERAWLGVGEAVDAAAIAAARMELAPSRAGALAPSALAPSVARAGDDGEAAKLASLERAHVERVLRQTGCRVSTSARVLGISRSTLYARMRAWNMDIDALRAAG